MSELNGKQAIKIDAAKISWASTDKAQMYDIDNVRIWVPRSVSQFTIGKESQEMLDNGYHRGDIKGTLLIHEWWFRKNFRGDLGSSCCK